MKIRWRVIRWLCGVLLMALLAAVGCLVWYLQSDAFQAFARTEVVARCRVPPAWTSPRTAPDRHPDRRFLVRGFTLKPRQGKEGTFRLSLDQATGKFHLGVLIRMKPHVSELVLVRPRIWLMSGGGSSTWRPDAFLKVFKQSLDLAIARLLSGTDRSK